MYSELDKEHLLRFGAQVRALRLAQGYSQEAFADACKLHRTYMGGVERGERNLSLLNIVKIAETLGTSPNILFGANEGKLLSAPIPTAQGLNLHKHYDRKAEPEPRLASVTGASI